MNVLIAVSIILGWFTAIGCAWAFVHGAQILRRQEVAALIASAQEPASRADSTAAVSSITSGSDGLKSAA